MEILNGDKYLVLALNLNAELICSGLYTGQYNKAEVEVRMTHSLTYGGLGSKPLSSTPSRLLVGRPRSLDGQSCHFLLLSSDSYSETELRLQMECVINLKMLPGIL